MATYDDITPELIERIATHHDAHPTDYARFDGDNGLVLVTSQGWALDPAKPGNGYNFVHRIERAVQLLRGKGGATLQIDGGTSFVFINIECF